jgi:hypothetical protein
MKTSKVVTIASASIVSVLLAVSLVVASIAYFPNNAPTATATSVKTVTTSTHQTTTVTTVREVTTTINPADMGNVSCGLFLHEPWYLNLPSNGTLKEDGTTIIGGTEYWYVSFVMGNLTSVNFQGVNFAFNSSQGPITMGASITIYNFTQLTVSAVQYNTTRSGPQGCGLGYPLPQITITFKDGSSVVYNRFSYSITKTSSLTIINGTFDKPTSNPWFTQHVSPQAGIAYQVNGGQITLYVGKS